VRNVKSAYICPRHPQQNYAKGYLGRITAMASFGMVHSGAPLFMWIYSVKCAVFTGNICASFYPKYTTWATPYEIVHNEPFPDASIIVPFGCAALVLRDSDDRPKFQNRCTMMIFVHYADEHPLFTYALYSPRTKRVIYRQDVIFLTSVIPMRQAREGTGLGPDGDKLLVFRSPPSMRENCEQDLSFGHWDVTDDLPPHDDDVTPFGLNQPYAELLEDPVDVLNAPVDVPQNPNFPLSSVVVPIRSRPQVIDPAGLSTSNHLSASLPMETARQQKINRDPPLGPLAHNHLIDAPSLDDEATTNDPVVVPLRRPVHQRWTYEVVPSSEPSHVPADLPKRISRPPRRLGMGVKPLIVDFARPPDSSSHSPSADNGSSSSEVTTPNIGLPLRAPPASPPGSADQDSEEISQGQSPHPSGNRYSIGDGNRTGRFVIQLTFPGGELPDQPFAVTTSMTVPILQQALTRLMDSRHGVHIFVGPSWAALDHAGLIVALHVPGTSTPCPALVPGSRVRVVTKRPRSSDDDDMDTRKEDRGGNTRKEDRGGMSDSNQSSGMSSLPSLQSLPTMIPDDDEQASKCEVSPLISVNRRERALLMTTFCREQRLTRKNYICQLRVTFDAEVEERKVDRDATTFFPTLAECLAEAWENYLFEYVVRFDEDQRLALVAFRSSLRIEPQHPDDYNRTLSLARTNELWRGLRRVYFGEQEPEPDDQAIDEDPVPAPSQDQILRDLRNEIASLEQNAALAQSQVDWGRRGDDGRPALPFRRDDSDDPDPPHPPFGASVGSNTLAILLSPAALQPDPSSQQNSSTSVAGSQSDDSTIFLDQSHRATSQHEQLCPLPSQSKVCDSDFLFAGGDLDLSSAVAPPLVPLSATRKLILLSRRVIRRVLATKESIFK
jgi:hypothetical protein